MFATEREKQLLEAMLLLKEESQRLVRRHREVMEEFDLVKEELFQIRRERHRQPGRGIASQVQSKHYYYTTQPNESWSPPAPLKVK